MAESMLVSPGDIRPSQNYLKESTVRFIFECLRTGQIEALPPTPLVRVDADGNLVAIDGHNLIAVYWFRGQKLEVISVTSATDGLPPTSEANNERNKELAAKYDTVLDDQRLVAAEGIASFADLVAQYPKLFVGPVASRSSEA